MSDDIINECYDQQDKQHNYKSCWRSEYLDDEPLYDLYTNLQAQYYQHFKTER